jgi:hypothetical protein
VIAEARVNVAYRYFLDLSLDSELPVPVDPEPTRQRFEEAISWAHHVLADQDRPPSKKKGEKRDRLLSLVAPEARQGKHGIYYAGYQLDISLDASSELLTAVNVLPANGDEAADAETLIRTEEMAHHNDIQELYQAHCEPVTDREPISACLSASLGLAQAQANSSGPVAPPLGAYRQDQGGISALPGPI